MLAWGIRAIPLGIGAIFLTFILKSAGTQPGPAEVGSAGPGISVFGTIHPDIFRLRAPLGSGAGGGRLQLASLDPQVGSDAPSLGFGTLADTPVPPCRNAGPDERVAVFDDANAEGCAASFEQRFSSAAPALVGAPASPQARDTQVRPAAAPKPLASVARISPVQPRKEPVLLPGDDGRTAVYDITAHTVYLPGGRRLEAHSGLGVLMDSPRHVHLRMRGATPPNIYNLAFRERIFHGVRALRLNPLDDSRMHGRGGILAHTYMLGSNGQSNGCVAFRNYPEFLDAFAKGEVKRLAVVERLESPPGKLAAGQLPEPVKELMKATDPSRKYAAAGER